MASPVVSLTSTGGTLGDDTYKSITGIRFKADPVLY
jgi:hypothetical protein